MSKLRLVKILRWIITKATGGIPQCYVQKTNLGLPALCDFIS